MCKEISRGDFLAVTSEKGRFKFKMRLPFSLSADCRGKATKNEK